MSFPLTINGTAYPYPNALDNNWAPLLINWSTAVTSGMLQTGGSNAFTLLKSATSNPASSGALRLANGDNIAWRNGLGNGNLFLTVDASNNLLFNGVAVGTPTTLTNAHIFVGNGSNVPTDAAMSGDVHIANTGATTVQSGAITGSKIASGTITESNVAAGTLTNTSINASAAISMSKLAALNAFITPVTDSSGFLTNSAVTATELGFVHGATSNLQTQINAITGAGSFLPGMIQMYGATSAPSGWLLCDGAAVSRTTYSSLFGVIGTSFGVGDGSTTFNTPNFSNRTGVGYGGSIAASIGTTAGAATHTLSVSEIPAGLTVTDPGHNHPYGAPSPSISVDSTGSTRVVVPGGSNNQNTTGSSATGISVGGGGTAHSIVQPSLGINYIIKT